MVVPIKDFGNFIFENNVFKQYHFEGGYIVNRGTPINYRYYVKDRLGNNRIVAKGDGTVEQHMDYYPYGGHLSFCTNMGTL